MITTRPAKNRSILMLLLSTLLLSGLTVGGCAYGGIAYTPDGSVLVARNSLLGALRKIYVCKLVGTGFNCVEATNAP